MRAVVHAVWLVALLCAASAASSSGLDSLLHSDIADVPEPIDSARAASWFSDLKRANQSAIIMYQMVADLHNLFSAFGVDYWATAGALLGAKRHQGIIPWDDDVDLMVLSKHEHILTSDEFNREAGRFGYSLVEWGPIYRLIHKDAAWPFVELWALEGDGDDAWQMVTADTRQIREDMHEDRFLTADLYPRVDAKFGSTVISVQSGGADRFLQDEYGANWRSVARVGKMHISDDLKSADAVRSDLVGATVELNLKLSIQPCMQPTGPLFAFRPQDHELPESQLDVGGGEFPGACGDGTHHGHTPQCIRDYLDHVPATLADTTTSEDGWDRAVDLFRVKQELAGPEQCVQDSKALLFMPVGGKNADHVIDTVGKFANSNCFDVLLAAYDDFDWSSSVLATHGNVRIVSDRGQKWRLAFKHLSPSATSKYSHVLLWDDDIIIPQDSKFSPDLYLWLISELNIDVSQPWVSTNGHDHVMSAAAYTGWTDSSNNESDFPKPHIIEHWFVEIMAPAYTHEKWACLFRFLEQHQSEIPHWGMGWGLDTSVLPTVCGAISQPLQTALIMSMHVSHADGKTGLGMGSGAGEQGRQCFEATTDIVRQQGHPWIADALHPYVSGGRYGKRLFLDADASRLSTSAMTRDEALVAQLHAQQQFATPGPTAPGGSGVVPTITPNPTRINLIGQARNDHQHDDGDDEKRTIIIAAALAAGGLALVGAAAFVYRRHKLSQQPKLDHVNTQFTRFIQH